MRIVSVFGDGGDRELRRLQHREVAPRVARRDADAAILALEVLHGEVLAPAGRQDRDPAVRVEHRPQDAGAQHGEFAVRVERLLEHLFVHLLAQSLGDGLARGLELGARRLEECGEACLFVVDETVVLCRDAAEEREMLLEHRDLGGLSGVAPRLVHLATAQGVGAPDLHEGETRRHLEATDPLRAHAGDGDRIAGLGELSKELHQLGVRNPGLAADRERTAISPIDIEKIDETRVHLVHDGIQPLGAIAVGKC